MDDETPELPDYTDLLPGYDDVLGEMVAYGNRGFRSPKMLAQVPYGVFYRWGAALKKLRAAQSKREKALQDLARVSTLNLVRDALTSTPPTPWFKQDALALVEEMLRDAVNQTPEQKGQADGND